MANSFLNNIDTEKVQKLLSDTTDNVSYFNETVNLTVRAYSEALDNLMADLYEQCIKTNNSPTELLENYYLELSNMIYFMGEKLERLGVYADMSKSAAKEVYSKAYLDNQVKDSINKKNKTTVAECQAVADIASQYQTVVNSIYEHAYKIVKYKIEAAKDMMNTLRKIITRRMQEYDFYKYNREGSYNSTSEEY